MSEIKSVVASKNEPPEQQEVPSGDSIKRRRVNLNYMLRGKDGRSNPEDQDEKAVNNEDLISPGVLSEEFDADPPRSAGAGADSQAERCPSSSVQEEEDQPDQRKEPFLNTGLLERRKGERSRRPVGARPPASPIFTATTSTHLFKPKMMHSQLSNKTNKMRRSSSFGAVAVRSPRGQGQGEHRSKKPAIVVAGQADRCLEKPKESIALSSPGATPAAGKGLEIYVTSLNRRAQEVKPFEAGNEGPGPSLGQYSSLDPKNSKSGSPKAHINLIDEQGLPRFDPRTYKQFPGNKVKKILKQAATQRGVHGHLDRQASQEHLKDAIKRESKPL